MATNLKTTNSQLKVQSFNFSTADPAINYTDGIYNTNLVIKNNASIFWSGIKYFQDLSAAPSGVIIEVLTTTTVGEATLNFSTTPFTNPVNGYTAGNVVPGTTTSTPHVPSMGGAVNNDNVSVYLGFSGLTAHPGLLISGIVYVIYVEFEF